MECVSDLGHGVACKGKCETQVEAAQAEIQTLNQMVERGKISRNAYYKKLAAVFVLAGMAILAIGLLSWTNGRGVILMPVGLLSLLAAYLYFSMAKSYSVKIGRAHV